MGGETWHAQCAKKLSRQYVCSLHFSETDFTLGDETSLDRFAVPNLSTGASHSNSVQHQLVWYHTVYNKHKELLQSGNQRKIQHMVLTLPSGLLFLGQWHNTCKVTNSTVRIIQEPNFCYYSCKNLAKMRQVHQGAMGLCQKIMTLKWNNYASFCVVATVIQIMSMT